MCIRVAVVTCSRCKKPGCRDQNCFARNKSIEKLPFLEHEHRDCSLHRTNQQDNRAYIVQRRWSKHCTSHHHRCGQANGRRDFDPTSTTLVDAYNLQLISAFSSQPHRVLRSSTPAHIFYCCISASSRSTATSSSTSSVIFSSSASSRSTSSATARASSSPPEGIGYSFIATSSNDINTKAIHFPLATNKHSVDNQHFEGTCFRGVWYISSKEGPNGHDYANSSTYNVEIRLQRQRLLHQRLQEQHMCKNILVQSLIDTVRT